MKGLHVAGSYLLAAYCVVAIAIAPANAAPAKPAKLAVTPGARTCVSTDWISDSNSASHVTSIPNSLKTTALTSVMIYFSPGADSSVVYPLSWPYSYQDSGNPVTVELTQSYINLHIYAGEPLHGVWDARTSTWRKFSTGFWSTITCN